MAPLAVLLSDLRYVAARHCVRAKDLADYGDALVDLGWIERIVPCLIVMTLDGKTVLDACRGVALGNGLATPIDPKEMVA